MVEHVEVEVKAANERLYRSRHEVRGNKSGFNFRHLRKRPFLIRIFSAKRMHHANDGSGNNRFDSLRRFGGKMASTKFEAFGIKFNGFVG